MSFDPLRRYPRARRAAPWVAWGLACAVVLVLAPDLGTVGVVAASVEVRPVTVLAPRTARVARVHVKAGDAVQAGSPLVELDAASVELELALARAELERARSAVRARCLEVRARAMEASARLAQESERAAVDLAAIAAEQGRDRAELSQLEAQIARQQELVDTQLASSEQLDGLLLQRASVAQRVRESVEPLAAARAHARAARERWRVWRASLAGLEPEPHALATAPCGPDPSPALVDTSSAIDPRLGAERTEVALHEERVRQLETARMALVVRAPVAGRVAEVHVGPGDTARAEAPAVVLVDHTPALVVAWVDERAARRVGPGTRVMLAPSDRGGSWHPASVRAVAPFIGEVPARFRPVPTQPLFGRAVYIELPELIPAPLPGQAFDVRLGGAP